MPRLTSTGKCQLCQRTFSKQAMSRHLAKCLAEKGAAKRGGGKRRPPRLFHLFIDGGGPYWLHVEVLASITLEMLDGFLRAIWLECCGHLSAFQIGGQRYSVQPIREDWIKERDMHVSLGKVLEAGMKFSYEYDFGTTTELQLKVVGERAGAVLDQATPGSRPALFESIPPDGEHRGVAKGKQIVHSSSSPRGSTDPRALCRM